MSYSYSVELIDSVRSSFSEEDSYSFLSFYQSYKKWLTYDSFNHNTDYVVSLVNNFINFHGKVDFPEHLKLKDSYWSVVPLGTFKYKMLADGTPFSIAEGSSFEGYLVSGMYWSNGFFYLVRNDKEIVQIKLFIDEDTKLYYNYP